MSKRNGQKLLVIDGIRFFRNRTRAAKQYWKCSYYYKTKCPTLCIIDESTQKLQIIHKHMHVKEEKPLVFCALESS